jgi:hypothetical protein
MLARIGCPTGAEVSREAQRESALLRILQPDHPGRVPGTH